MKSTYDFYESASFVGSKKEVIEALESMPSIDGVEVVRKSDRVWAIFEGESTFVVPDWEKPMDAKEWLSLMAPPVG